MALTYRDTHSGAALVYGDTAYSAPASSITGISISPTTASGSITFSKTVTGNGAFDPSATFSIYSGGGSVDPVTGAFIQPVATGSIQTIVVRVTSTQDPSFKADATITIAAEVNGTVATNTITYPLITRDGVPRANLSGLGWALFSQLNPGQFTAPIAKGTLETTDGSAVLLIPVLASAVPVGAYMLALSNADNSATVLAAVMVS